MENLWQGSAGGGGNPEGPGFWPKKILGMSGALVKSVVLAAIGLALQFILFLVKRGKARRLEEIKKKEEEEARERMRLMEEEWKA